MLKNKGGGSMKLPSNITINGNDKPVCFAKRKEAEYICDALYRKFDEYPFINEVFVVVAPNTITRQPQQVAYKTAPFSFHIDKIYSCPVNVPDDFSWDKDYFKED